MNRLDGIVHKKVGQLAFYSAEDRQASKEYWKAFNKACKFIKDLGIEIK